jgi:hypothetical protein
MQGSLPASRMRRLFSGLNGKVSCLARMNRRTTLRGRSERWSHACPTSIPARTGDLIFTFSWHPPRETIYEGWRPAPGAEETQIRGSSESIWICLRTEITDRTIIVTAVKRFLCLPSSAEQGRRWWLRISLRKRIADRALTPVTRRKANSVRRPCTTFVRYDGVSYRKQ